MHCIGRWLAGTLMNSGYIDFDMILYFLQCVTYELHQRGLMGKGCHCRYGKSSINQIVKVIGRYTTNDHQTSQERAGLTIEHG